MGSESGRELQSGDLDLYFALAAIAAKVASDLARRIGLCEELVAGFTCTCRSRRVAA
jgi:hypothetical protein